MNPNTLLSSVKQNYKGGNSKNMDLIKQHMAQINKMIEKSNEEAREEDKDNRLTSQNLNQLNMLKEVEKNSDLSSVLSGSVGASKVSKVSKASAKSGHVKTYAEKMFDKYKQQEFNKI